MGKHFTDFGIFAPKHFTDFGKIRLKHFLLIHYLSIKQADGAMGYLGIMLIMCYHDDGGALVHDKDKSRTKTAFLLIIKPLYKNPY